MTMVPFGFGRAAIRVGAAGYSCISDVATIRQCQRALQMLQLLQVKQTLRSLRLDAWGFIAVGVGIMAHFVQDVGNVASTATTAEVGE